MTQYLFRWLKSSDSYLIVSVFKAGDFYFFKLEDVHGEGIRQMPDTVVTTGQALDYVQKRIGESYKFIGRIRSVCPISYLEFV